MNIKHEESTHQVGKSKSFDNRKSKGVIPKEIVTKGKKLTLKVILIIWMNRLKKVIKIGMELKLRLMLEDVLQRQRRQ